MASERVLDAMVRRHVFDTGRPFARVLDGIFSGIRQPDITQLFSKLAASSTYQEFSSLVEHAQSSAGLMRFPPPPARPRQCAVARPAGRGLDRAPAGPPDRRQPGHHGPDDPPRARRRLVRTGHHPHRGNAGRRYPRGLRLRRRRDRSLSQSSRLRGRQAARHRSAPAPARGNRSPGTGSTFTIRGDDLVGFHNSATTPDLGFYGARSYSLMRPPRTGRRWIRSWERSAGGVGLEYANSAVTCYFS